MPPPPARIILCPGQGAQFVGMGKAWFDTSPEARAVFENADRLLGDRLGTPLSRLCFEGPAERLNQTDASQPAIYTCSVACWAGLLSTWQAGNGLRGGGIAEGGVLATAGLSLGEYTALHLAGVFDFEQGLELVTLRGRAMQDAADSLKNPDGTPGSGMLALIGADASQAEAVCVEARGPDVLVAANFNAPGQVVLSGHLSACRRAMDSAAKLGLKATLLPVAGAFHSSIMAPAAERLRAALTQTPLHPPRCPVMSNVTAQPHAPDSGTIEDSIRARLVAQLTSPVRWEEDCRYLAGHLHGPAGAAAGATPPEFHELAPGKTLAGLMRRIDRAIKVETHDEP